MRSCADELERGILSPGELLQSDELTGPDRERLRTGLSGLKARFLTLALTAENLASEWRRQIRCHASA
jgi:hypothetical protein